MTEPRPLPDLHGAELDATTLARLFEDLADHAAVDEVVLKGAATSPAAPDRVTLETARAALTARAVRGAQVHYRWDGQRWCDTLLVTPGGWRVVRLQTSGL